MWDELLEDLDLDEAEGPNLKASFFVGDAGGRAARRSGKADHACSDRSDNTDISEVLRTDPSQGLRCQCRNRLQDSRGILPQ